MPTKRYESVATLAASLRSRNSAPPDALVDRLTGGRVPCHACGHR